MYVGDLLCTNFLNNDPDYYTKVIITAKNIFVRTGKPSFGTKAVPFTSNVLITLIGTKDDPPLIIESSMKVQDGLSNTDTL